MRNRKSITAILTALLVVSMLVTCIFPVFAEEIVPAYEVTEAEDDSAMISDEDQLSDELVLSEDADITDEDVLEEIEIEIDLDEATEIDDESVLLQEIPAKDSTYSREALPVDLKAMPGVYKVKAYPGESLAGDNPDSIGIPSIAKDKLDKPTKESPAIIMGAAVNYEKKTGPTSYEAIEGAELVAPYSYFRWSVINEQLQNEDGTISTHEKLSGFDGSYYIIRVDVSDIIKDKSGYLHVKQESNKALMVAYGIEGDNKTFSTFSDATGSKTGAYSLADNAKALKDTNGSDTETPYFDVIVYSSGKLAAGADAGSANAPSADIKLSFYVDDTIDYDPALIFYDAATLATKATAWPWKADNGVEYATELDYKAALLTKFYIDEFATAENNASSYLVKGSDMEIDVMVDEQESPDDVQEFWSLTKAMHYQPFDSHVVKLICEVPVLEGLSVESTDGSKRSVILDVNSFDIQIANNTEQGSAGLTISNNAELRIQDGTQTSGAELAIGNNATMIIKKGGVMIIDESCTNEVEYDAATAVDPAQDKTGSQFNGEITVDDGGTLINYGVINIEGPEAKPIDPNQQEQQDGQSVITDMKTADMVINKGGLIENYGCLSLKGVLYMMGTLNNYGKYNDTIDAHDPDKGTTSYHKGIQLTWKDVVTREGVEPGILDIGIDADGNIESSATVNNYGDIVVFPGTINNYGTFNNLKLGDYAGHLYTSTVDEAIIPIIPTQEAPLVVEKRIKLDPVKESVINTENGTMNLEEGIIGTAKVELIHNGVPGKLIPLSVFATSLTLDKEKATVGVSASVTLKTAVKPEEAKDTKITWTSSDPKIATVDEKGKVTGVNIGTATITAEAEGGFASASCEVTVRFSDVMDPGKYYFNPVYWAAENGITKGFMTEADKKTGLYGKFGFDQTATRAQVVTFLWRMEGQPEPKSTKNPFEDVKPSAYYYKAVLWAAEKGITKGYTTGANKGKFLPDAKCLREHVVTFLWRYAGKPEPTVKKNPFNDVKRSDYYYKASVWANQNGIAKGYSTGKYKGGFGPKLNSLREHVVTFLYRYANMKK